MSKGYQLASEPAKFEFVEAVAAGSSSVTAMDMTHFMIAHLQDGQYEGVQILKPGTAKSLEMTPQLCPRLLADCGLVGNSRDRHSDLLCVAILEGARAVAVGASCDVVVALACIGVAWFVFTWNMLHWSLKY